MPNPDEWIPVAEDVLTVRKRWVPTGRVRVETRTETAEEIAEAALARCETEVLRVPVGREVDAVPEVRTEGEVTILPVVEERLVVERRLVLTEEIHIKRHRTIATERVPVTLRKQRAIISREGRETVQRSSTIMDTITDNRALTAFFDDRSAAEAAMQRLRDLGLTDASIGLTGGEEYAGRPEFQADRGFLGGLLDFFLPAEDSVAYEEGLRRGGYLLTVSGVPAADYERVIDILDDEGSVDIDERAATWRSEGWSGAAEATTGAGAGALGRTTQETWGDAMAPGAGTDFRDVAASSSEAGADFAAPETTEGTPGVNATGEEGFGNRTGEEETIPVIEERLRVGKRDVSLGRVRVRSYVVEEPASADVTLREERVEVERRPVDRPVAVGEDAFLDRTLEAEERAEEAVVSKEARVKEEVGLRRESDERTETVSDTVRRTEVEVEDDRESGLRGETTRRGA